MGTMEEEGADELPEERVQADEHMRVLVPDSPMGGSRLPNVNYEGSTDCEKSRRIARKNGKKHSSYTRFQ